MKFKFRRGGKSTNKRPEPPANRRVGARGKKIARGVKMVANFPNALFDFSSKKFSQGGLFPPKNSQKKAGNRADIISTVQ